MASENIEILQANNLHLFHHNQVLSEKVSQLTNKLMTQQKILDKLLKCLSDELLIEIEDQLVAIKLQLINLDNDKQIDDETFKNLTMQLDNNKLLLDKILNGKNKIIQTINDQIIQINHQDQKITSLEKECKFSKESFIKLMNRSFDQIEEKNKMINSSKEDINNMRLSIKNQQMIIKNLQDKLFNIQNKQKYHILFRNQLYMLGDFGKYQINFILSIIMCLFLIFATYIITKRSKNTHFNKHKCNFCINKHKNK